MKKLILLLVMGLLLVPAVASAASPITYNSGFQVQNLSGDTANILVAYYNEDGTEATGSPWSDTIAGNGSNTYYPIHPSGTFNGSVVVSSDQQVVAISNLLGDGVQYAASTNGFSAGADMVSLPLVMRNNSGYNTWFRVQNAGSSDATVTVNYYPVPGQGNAATEGPVTIKPGAAATFDQATNTDLGAKFVGSAVVTSDEPVVASLMQVGTTYKNMMGYNGFIGGSTQAELPLIMANNSGYYTGIQVQNAGTVSTTVTVDYAANTAGSWNPTDDAASLNPGESATFLQAGGQWGTNKYIGAASVTSSPAEELVAIVNQVKMTGVALGTAYEGFDPAGATPSISAPLIMGNNSGYYTGFQVQNVSGAAVTVDVTYGPNSVGTFSPAPEQKTNLQPGESWTFIQSTGQWGSYGDVAKKYVGSATIAAGGNIVAIVNEVNPTAAGDQFMTYNGFNY